MGSEVGNAFFGGMLIGFFLAVLIYRMDIMRKG